MSEKLTHIIISAILSEKSNMLVAQDKYVFKVSVKSNKMQRCKNYHQILFPCCKRNKQHDNIHSTPTLF